MTWEPTTWSEELRQFQHKVSCSTLDWEYQWPQIHHKQLAPLCFQNTWVLILLTKLSPTANQDNLHIYIIVMQIERLKRVRGKCWYRLRVIQDVGKSWVELRKYGRHINTIKANVCWKVETRHLHFDHTFLLLSYPHTQNNTTIHLLSSRYLNNINFKIKYFIYFLKLFEIFFLHRAMMRVVQFNLTLRTKQLKLFGVWFLPSYLNHPLLVLEQMIKIIIMYYL